MKVIQSVFKSERFPFGGTQNLRPSIVQLTRHYKSLWKLKTRKILLMVSACVLLGDLSNFCSSTPNPKGSIQN